MALSWLQTIWVCIHEYTADNQRALEVLPASRICNGSSQSEKTPSSPIAVMSLMPNTSNTSSTHSCTPLPEYTNTRIRETHHQDEHLPNPLTIHNYLSRTMYNRRTKMDPLWNSLL